MPIAQRREASNGCGCRHSIGGARACSTSHEWRGSPPIGPSASTLKTFGKYRLNFPAIFSGESRNKGRRWELAPFAGEAGSASCLHTFPERRLNGLPRFVQCSDQGANFV